MICTRCSIRLATVTPNFQNACCLPSPVLKHTSSSHCFQFPQLSQRSLLSPGCGSIAQFSGLLNSQLTELRDVIPVAFYLLFLSAVERQGSLFQSLPCLTCVIPHDKYASTCIWKVLSLEIFWRDKDAPEHRLWGRERSQKPRPLVPQVGLLLDAEGL